MDFRQLNYMLKVAQERSFSKAAQKLYISQPSLSQYIQKLETQLGMQLFDRTTTPVRLTYAGELYVETAKRILELNNQLSTQMEDIAHLKKGRLTIGLPPSRSTYILPDVLPAFHQKFPGIEIILIEGNSLELEACAVKGDIDVWITTLPINEDLFLYTPIFTEEILVAVPPGHPLAKGKCEGSGQRRAEISLSLLKEEPFILTKHNLKLRAIADNLFKIAGIKPNIVLESKSIEAAHALAAAGMGVTFVPETIVWPGQTARRPVYFSIEGVRAARTVAVAYLKGRYLSRAANEFIAIAKETYPSGI